jgi:hypothetical protein
MKTQAKLACFILLGLVASGVFLLLLSFVISIVFPRMEESEIYPILGFFILIPFSIMAGSSITGFLSRPLLKNKWVLFLLPPGLFLPIFLIFTVPSAEEIIDFLLATLYLYLFSLTGVAIGFWVRVLIKRRVHTA